MAWIEVTPILSLSTAIKEAVRYKVTKPKGAATMLGVTVGVPTSIIKELGWETKQRLRIAMGGNDMNMIRLAPDTDGMLEVRTTARGGFYVKCGWWDKLPPREVDQITVAHVVESCPNGFALVITLPKHALMVAPAPAPVTYSAPAPKPAPPPPIPADRDSMFNRQPRGVGLASGTRRSGGGT